MGINSENYLVISSKQTQPLDVVDKCLKYFADFYKIDQEYKNYDIMKFFYSFGVGVFVRGTKEDLTIIRNHLLANEINSEILEEEKVWEKYCKNKEKFDNNKKIKIIFGDQTFFAHPSITEVELYDTNEYDDYLVKTDGEL